MSDDKLVDVWREMVANGQPIGAEWTAVRVMDTNALYFALSERASMEGEIRKAMLLIGARNDNLTEAQRQGNINEAWHVLNVLTSSKTGD